MTNQTQQDDIRLLLMEVLADSRMLALLQYVRKMNTQRRKLLLRIARGLV